MGKDIERKRNKAFQIKYLLLIMVIIAISAFSPLFESNQCFFARANIVIQINDQSAGQDGLSDSLMPSLLKNKANQKKKQLLKKHTQLLQQIEQVDEEEAELNQQLLQVQQLQQVLQNQQEDTEEIVDKSRGDYLGSQLQRDSNLQQQDDEGSNSELSAEQALLLQEQIAQTPSLAQIQKNEKSDEEKSISVKVKLTDEIKKKMLESTKADQANGESLSLNIPIKDLANSTCTQSHCDGIVEAATKVITGSGQEGSGGQESQEADGSASLNITEVKEQRAKPSKVLDKVPKKRQKFEPKSLKKSSEKARVATDDDNGEKETTQNKRKSVKKDADDSVVKKSIKLKPVMPTVSDDQDNGESAPNSTNLTSDASNSSSSLDVSEQNQREKAKIKELVKKETDKLEKAKESKDKAQKDDSKPADSGAVDSIEVAGDKDKMKSTVLKLKEYSFEKKTEADGSTQKENGQPDQAANSTSRTDDSVSNLQGAQPTPKFQKKKTKRCYDVDEDSSGFNNTVASAQPQNKTPTANISEPTSIKGNNQSDEIPTVSGDIAPNMPAAPGKGASKEQKLKYLEDLEESLRRTKEQVKMEKAKEEAKAKEVPKLKSLDRDPDTLGSPPVPPPLDEENGDQISSSGDLEAEAKKSLKETKKEKKQKKEEKQAQEKETIDEKDQQSTQNKPIKKTKEEKAPASIKKTKKVPQSSKQKLLKPPEKALPKSPEHQISPDDIQIKIKKDNDDQATSPENVKPEDIEIKIKKDGEEAAGGSTWDNQSIQKNSPPLPESNQVPPIANQSDSPQIPNLPEPQNSDTSSSIVDQIMKQMEQSQKMEELTAKIEKEKVEVKKAEAKKDSILRVLKPKKQSEEGKKKRTGRVLEQAVEDQSKRKLVEDTTEEIQAINYTKKQGAVEEFEKFEADRDKVVINNKNIPECLQPKPRQVKSGASTISDTVAESNKQPVFVGGNKFSGDEDIDENLYFSTHALTQMNIMHEDLESQLHKKVEQEQINKKQDLEELLNSTKMMEKGDINVQLDFQKRLQMSKEFKELQDEEDRQENEALKAQMELEIAQTQIQKKQLEQKKALLKAHKASILKQSELKKQERKTKLEALHTAQTHQQEQMKQLQQKLLAQQKQDQLQKRQQEEQALHEAKQLASSVQAKLQKEKEEEEQRVAAEVAREEKETEERVEKAQKEERERKKRVEGLVKKNMGRYQALVQKVQEQALKFSLSLKVAHFEEAMKAREQIQNDAEMKEAGFEVPDIKVSTVDAFRKSFSFPQIALNDFAVEQLENLKNEENKFNNHLNDKVAFNQFIKTTQYVASQLSRHYGKQWVNPNQDGYTVPKKVSRPKDPKADISSTSSAISGLSLPQQFTNSFDFVPEFLSKQSEKELQTSQEQVKDQKQANEDDPPIDQTTVQQITPEEQEELNQSSIMSDEEQAKYQTMVDAQLQEQEQEQYRQQLLQDSEQTSPVPPEQDVSTIVQGATQKISQMALTTDDLQVSSGDLATDDATSLEGQSQVEEQNKIKSSPPAQTIQKQSQNNLLQKSVVNQITTQLLTNAPLKPSPKTTKNKKPTISKEKQTPISSQSIQLNATSTIQKDTSQITISGVPNSDTNTNKVAPETQSQTPTPEPEFQSQDIYGSIAQEDYVRGDDIDEIVGE